MSSFYGNSNKVFDSEADALKAEGYAINKQNGVNVGAGSPYYHNSAKYFASQAAASAISAAESAATFEIDTTLTVSGKAADAKATGDTIDAVKADVTNIPSNKIDIHLEGIRTRTGYNFVTRIRNVENRLACFVTQSEHYYNRPNDGRYTNVVAMTYSMPFNATSDKYKFFYMYLRTDDNLSDFTVDTEGVNIAIINTTDWFYRLIVSFGFTETNKEYYYFRGGIYVYDENGEIEDIIYSELVTMDMVSTDPVTVETSLSDRRFYNNCISACGLRFRSQARDSVLLTVNPDFNYNFSLANNLQNDNAIVPVLNVSYDELNNISAFNENSKMECYLYIDNQIVTSNIVYVKPLDMTAHSNISNGDYFEIDGFWYRAISDIAVNDTIVVGTNCEAIDEPVIISSELPTAPTENGTYKLQCVVSNGTPTYSWVSDS